MSKPVKTIATLGLTALLALGPAGADAADTNKPISVAVIDSSDADFVAYVYGGLLERNGFNVEYLRIDYSAMIPAIETGDLDVTTSIWDTTSWSGIETSVRDEAAVNYGSTGVAVREGWWYPTYMEEVCPGLPNWEALKTEACMAALATAETAPKGRYVDAPADWETDSQMRMQALGLDYEVVNSGSIVTMIATVRAAVERNEPIFSWGYVPHWYFDDTPGDFVALPAATSACFEDASVGPNPDATGDCGFSTGFIWKLANTDFINKSPEASRLLHLLRLSTLDVAKATGLVENDGESLETVAGAWLDANEAVWKSWSIE